MYTVPKIFPHETQEMQRYLWCFSPMYFTHHYPRYNCPVQYSMNRYIHSSRDKLEDSLLVQCRYFEHFIFDLGWV